MASFKQEGFSLEEVLPGFVAILLLNLKHKMFPIDSYKAVVLNIPNTFNKRLIPLLPFRTVLTLEQAESLCGGVFQEYHQKLKPRAKTVFEQRRQSLQITVNQTTSQQLILSTR